MKKFVLDTNVLLNDPSSILSFNEHHVILPMTVIEELDNIKSRKNDVSRDARVVIRQIEDIVGDSDYEQLKHGIKISEVIKGVPETALFSIIQDEAPVGYGTVQLDSEVPDNRIINTVISLQLRYPDDEIVLVSNDINMRLKAKGAGCKYVESCKKEKSLADIDILHKGYQYIGGSIFEQVSVSDSSINKDRKCIHTFPKNEVSEKLFGTLLINDYIHDDMNVLLRLTGKNEDSYFFIDIGSKGFKKTAWGVEAKNIYQTMAISSLLDSNIDLVVLLGPAGTGKAQPLYSKILTPTGWTTMGEIKIGDLVSTPDGKSAKVSGIFPQGKKDIYRVNFKDGRYADCCEDHLWNIYCGEFPESSRERTVDTKEIMRLLTLDYTKDRLFVQQTAPVEFSPKELPVDPYVLGILLGDGHLRNSGIYLSTADAFIKDEVEKLIGESYTLKHVDNYDYRLNMTTEENKNTSMWQTKGIIRHKFVRELTDMGLCGTHSDTKFIPEDYMWGSVEQRYSLIQGLMDSDGAMECHPYISTASKTMALQIQQLIRSIGGDAVLTESNPWFTYKGEKKQGKTAYNVSIKIQEPQKLFRLPRKQKERVRDMIIKNKIISVTKIGNEEAQCIMVDHPDHLYITDDFIVTHNTLLTVAAGLEQTMEKRTFDKIIFTRSMQSQFEEIGFLPGTETEKVAPWCGAAYDALEFIHRKDANPAGSLKLIEDKGIFQYKALTFIRGRSFKDKFLVIDEAQNLNATQMKTILTRAGEGTKIILMGNLAQIDNDYVSELSSGLTYVVEKFKGWEGCSIVQLQSTVRSRLADFAEQNL